VVPARSDSLPDQMANLLFSKTASEVILVQIRHHQIQRCILDRLQAASPSAVRTVRSAIPGGFELARSNRLESDLIGSTGYLSGYA